MECDSPDWLPEEKKNVHRKNSKIQIKCFLPSKERNSCLLSKGWQGLAHCFSPLQHLPSHIVREVDGKKEGGWRKGVHQHRGDSLKERRRTVIPHGPRNKDPSYFGGILHLWGYWIGMWCKLEMKLGRQMAQHSPKPESKCSAACPQKCLPDG